MWRDWLIFTAGELIYFVAIWWHLGGLLAPGDSSADRIYWLAVIIRLATQTWAGDRGGPGRRAPRARPRARRDGLDDPTGGVLDGAPDAAGVPGRRAGRRLGLGVTGRIRAESVG